MINCDLPWNPAKLEQRIARATSEGEASADISVPDMREALIEKIFADQHDLSREAMPLLVQLLEHSLQQSDLLSVYTWHQKMIEHLTRCFMSLDERSNCSEQA